MKLPPPPTSLWEVPPAPDRSKVRRLEEALGLPRPLCALLVVRGHGVPEAAKRFLRPSLADLHSPETLPDLSTAVDRIVSAIRGRETILIHGDYDVDGMAGVALLTTWLRRVGGNPVPFIPHRQRDGYDLGPAGLAEARACGASLLVTVDCGILAHEAVAAARDSGLDVIITDHHAPGETLPDALAVLNPARSDSEYPNPSLCGAGVAFKLCQGLAGELGVDEEELHPLLEFVGMATVADLVPLRGENRVLARFGLKALGQTRTPGLRALLDRAGFRQEAISAGNVGFGIAPRLNALGRLGEPMDGLSLLVTDDPEEARRLALVSEEVNRERQEADRRTLDEALEQLSREFVPERDFGIVLAGEGWHPGVVGIVASRLVERTHRPTVLIALDGDRGRGSARSIPDYHILDGIRSCEDLLERFGGHRQAAGMEVHRDRIPAFREAFNLHARSRLEGKELRPRLSVDLEVRLEEMSPDLHRYLHYMGPHGIGNPGPNFLAKDVTLAKTPWVVGTDHLKTVLRQGEAQLDGIGFHLAKKVSVEALGSGPLDVVFQLRENEFRGRRSLQAHIRDIRPSGPPSSAVGRGR